MITLSSGIRIASVAIRKEKRKAGNGYREGERKSS